MKEWYDDKFVTQFTHSPLEETYSGSDFEQQQASKPRENGEIRSNGTVVFSKRHLNAMNLHKSFTPQQSLTSPSNYAAIRSQSFSAQPEVKQPPLPGIFCFSPGSTNSPASSDAISADQSPAHVNVNSLLESILHTIQELNINQTQSPTLKDSPTQAIPEDARSAGDFSLNNSLASVQSSDGPGVVHEITHLDADETDRVCHSSPPTNNSQTTEISTEHDCIHFGSGHFKSLTVQCNSRV